MDDTHVIDLKIDADLSSVERSLSSMSKLSRTFGSSITNGLKSAVVQGKSFDSVLRSIGINLASNVLQAGLKPLQGLLSQGFSSLLGGFSGFLPFAKGGVLAGGSQPVPFAKGGVVATPSFFPAGGRVGLMGEAGGEAIMPLARGADGRLGVRSGDQSNASHPIQVTINTPDASSFRRSEGQVTAALTRAVQRGNRNL
ncbi:MAG: phage tail tape measure protein [Pseudomonadota bacterium]